MATLEELARKALEELVIEVETEDGKIVKTPFFYLHTERMVETAINYAEYLGIDKKVAEEAAWGHDVGKTAPEESKVLKDAHGKLLTPEQAKIIQETPWDSVRIIERWERQYHIQVDEDIKEGILRQWVWYNGKHGHPLVGYGNLTEKQKDLASLLLFADACDALRCKGLAYLLGVEIAKEKTYNGYVNPMPPSHLLYELTRHSGTQFDPRLIIALEFASLLVPSIKPGVSKEMVDKVFKKRFKEKE